MVLALVISMMPASDIYAKSKKEKFINNSNLDAEANNYWGACGSDDEDWDYDYDEDENYDDSDGEDCNYDDNDE